MAEPPVAETARPLTIEARPELTGGRRVGVLLSHGFTGSPASIRPWGEYLGERGYGVEVPRLPGHGTTWQDLNTRTWRDFYAEVSAAFERLRAAHDVVFVGGLSMGGALAMRLAADRGADIAGLVVVNPALATRRLDVKLLPVLKHLVPSFPGIADDIAKPGASEYGYTRTPLKAIHSFMKAWPGLIDDLPAITMPMLLFRSPQDHVVDDSSVRLIRERVGSVDLTEVSLPESYHVATLDHDAPRIFEQTAAFIEHHR